MEGERGWGHGVPGSGFSALGSGLRQQRLRPGPVSQSSQRGVGWHRGWEILSFFYPPSLSLSLLSAFNRSPPRRSDLSST